MRVLLTTLLSGGALMAFYAIVIERHWFALRTHVVPCLPPGARPIRVLHLSDLHLRAGQRRKRVFISRLQRIAPDLVIGTGDFLGDAVSNQTVFDVVAPLRGRIANLFVCGSNDYYSPVPKNPLRYFKRKRGRYKHGRQNPWQQMVAGLEGYGWTIINNRALVVDGIDIVGFDDPHINRADLSVASERAHDGFRLAVAHSPDVARTLADLGYDLIVCGHTHGGQLRVPGYGALVTNCDIPRAWARGLHQIGDAWLHVSAGLGTSMFAPFRFACRPEVCVLELVARHGSSQPVDTVSAKISR